MLWEVVHKTYLDSINPYLDDPGLTLPRCESAAELSYRHFLELLEFAKGYDFQSTEEEIRFFRDVQSTVYGHLKYFKQVKSFLLKGTIYKSANEKKRLKKALASAGKVLKKNKSFYEYIVLEKSHLDSLYFTRSACQDSNLRPPFLFDPKCTTPYCLLLGEIIAYRLFSKCLLQQRENKYKAHKQVQTLKWTGKKIDLIELVYALYASGVFNHGNASIRTIADSLQEHFGCTIGDIYRSYTDLRYRKKCRTKFLEQLTEKLSEKMESEEI